jgi:hypothetical protein
MYNYERHAFKKKDTAKTKAKKAKMQADRKWTSSTRANDADTK